MIVEYMVGSKALFLVVSAFVLGYLTCSTITLNDLEIKYDELKVKFENMKNEKEFLEKSTNHYKYKDVA